MKARLFFGASMALVLVVAGCSSSSESSDSPTSTTAAETATTTTAAATTTVAAAATTVPTTTAGSPTTTAGGQIAEVTLAHAGLIVAAEMYYAGQNGSDPDPVITAVTDALGPPTMDSGWGPHPISTGEFRSVQWGDSLILAFDDSEIPGEGPVRHFVSYSYAGSPSGIFTVMDGITVGITVGETIAAVSSYRPDVGLDQYRWVRSSLAEIWVLEAGNAEFGYLCFDTGLTTQPSDDAETVAISAGLDCSYDGE
ncbi:MAG: hypothetical protein WBO25_01905 [Acidimicrobiia bacterium]